MGKMSSFLFTVVMVSTLVVTSAQLYAHQFENIPRLANLTIDNTCYLDLSPSTKLNISGMLEMLRDDQFDILYLNFEINFNQTTNLSDIFWTIANPHRTSLMNNSDFVMMTHLRNRIKVLEIKANITCPPEINNRFMSYDISGFPNIFTDGLLPELSDPSAGIIEACNGSNCTEPCGKAVEEPVLIIVTYCWVITILLYSPHIVYMLYDALHIRDDSITHYQTKDWPYSLKRFLLKTSAVMIACCPVFRKRLRKRPVTRAILILWIINVVIQVFHIWLQVSSISSKLAYKELDHRMNYIISQIQRYHIYAALVFGGMFLTIILLHMVDTETFTHLLDDSEIFMFSSTGVFHKGFMKKMKLNHFLKHTEATELSEGQRLISMHAERFMLIFNVRFWFLVLKESFSGLFVKEQSACCRCFSFLPIFTISVWFLTMNVALNFLWGAFPLLGIFFTCLSIARSWMELIRVCFLAVYFVFFVMVICGNNLVFLFNIIIYTTLYTLPCSSFDELSNYFMAFPILLYMVIYWKTFTGSYKTLLELIFKTKLENQLGQDYVASNGKTYQLDCIEKVSIKEFNFVCGQCSPVRKKVLNIFVKIIVTGIFMILTFTILFLKKQIDTFSKIAKIIAFAGIVLLPRIIEKFWSGDGAKEQDELAKKVGVAVQRWDSGSRTNKTEIRSVEMDGVACTWYRSCYHDSKGDNCVTDNDKVEQTDKDKYGSDCILKSDIEGK